jgi:hypothetical protein
MRLVQPHQLVLDILQNGTDGSQWENVAAFLHLDFLVSGCILSEVGEGNGRLDFHCRAIIHSLANGSAELAEHIVASVNDERQVSLTTFRAKD